MIEKKTKRKNHVEKSMNKEGYELSDEQLNDEETINKQIKVLEGMRMYDSEARKLEFYMDECYDDNLQ